MFLPPLRVRDALRLVLLPILLAIVVVSILVAAWWLSGRRKNALPAHSAARLDSPIQALVRSPSVPLVVPGAVEGQRLTVARPQIAPGLDDDEACPVRHDGVRSSVSTALGELHASLEGRGHLRDEAPSERRARSSPSARRSTSRSLSTRAGSAGSMLSSRSVSLRRSRATYTSPPKPYGASGWLASRSSRTGPRCVPHLLVQGERLLAEHHALPWRRRG